MSTSMFEDEGDDPGRRPKRRRSRRAELPSSIRVHQIVVAEPSAADAGVGVVQRINLGMEGPPFFLRLWLMGDAIDGFRLEQPGVDHDGNLRVDPSPFTDAARSAIQDQVFELLDGAAPRTSWHELHLVGMARTRREREEDRGW